MSKRDKEEKWDRISVPSLRMQSAEDANDDKNEKICHQWNDDDLTEGNIFSDFQRSKI